MSEKNNVVNGEFAEKVVKSSSLDKDALQGIMILAAVGGVSYVMGKRVGIKRGIDSHSAAMNLFVKGLLAGKESVESEA